MDLVATRVRHTPRKRLQPWQAAAAAAVGTAVAFSVLLMSVAYGVSHDITRRLSGGVLRQSHLIDVGLINNILFLLTIVVTLAMLAQTAASTFVLGVTVMRSRREEIALRRQSGALRSTLLLEFMRTMLAACLIGGAAGELVGIIAAAAIGHLTVLPVRFTPISLLGAFPVAVVLALLATLVPAWQAVGASPALLRKE